MRHKEVIAIGLFDYIFNKKEKENLKIDEYFKLLNGYSPVFTTYQGSLYEMDLTRSAIRAFARHCSKLKPEVTGSALRRLEKVLQFKPNYFMDTVKFISRIATIFECENNVFIVPVEDETGGLQGWYPLMPQQCEIIEHKKQVYLRYTFANGERAAVEFDRVGILTQDQYRHDIFGEDNNTLSPTMQLLHVQNQGMINAVKSSANIRFLAKIGNILKDDDIRKERKRFTEENLGADNQSGMIIYDGKFTDLKPVESRPYTVNSAQMQQINENVFIHFGINMDILQNKFDENTWNAYYEGKIEPFAIQLSIVMSNMSFTPREQAHGNSIIFSANRLQYASNNTKLQVSVHLFDRGLLNRNSIMDIWNMPHVEGGDEYYIRKEYTEVGNLDKGLDLSKGLNDKEGDDMDAVSQGEGV